MLDDDGTLRAVAWFEVCPWLHLFRCFRLALWPRMLVLSAIAVLLTVSGWALLVILFSGDPEIREQAGLGPGSPWLSFPDLVQSASTDLVDNRPQLPKLDFASVGENLSLDLTANESAPSFQRTPDPFWGTYLQLREPIRRVFASDVTVTKAALWLLCGLWALAVWAFFGGAVTRVAAVQLGLEERIDCGAMIRHAGSRWLSYFAAPFFLLVVVLGFAAAMGLAGILLWWNSGLLIVGVLFWPLMLVGGFVMAYFLLWLAFGWPLMWPAISVEGQDCFEALSRSNTYVYQRPLHYLFYALVAVLLGWLGWLVVSNFAAAIIALTNWAVDWGADTSRWPQWLGDPSAAGSRRIELLRSGGAEIGTLGSLGLALILFWCGCVKMLAVGFLYSYFWTASTCIYLLLRHDADATEMDEIFMEEEEDELGNGLPPLETDEAGAPVVGDHPAPQSEETESPKDRQPPPGPGDPSSEQ